jgi:hypothetical protein
VQTPQAEVRVVLLVLGKVQGQREVQQQRLQLRARRL